MHAPMTQGEIESAMAGLEHRLDELSDEFRQCAIDYANAEATYRVRRARAELAEKVRTKCSDATAKNRATQMLEKELRDREIADAMKESALRAWFTCHDKLEAMRTRSANVRAQT